MLGTYTVGSTRVIGCTVIFSPRYKSLVIDETDNFYLRVACDYVHLNPARAGLVGSDQMLEQYAWSSYPHYLRNPTERPAWLRTDRVLGEHGISADNRSGRLELSRRMEAERQGPGPGEENNALLRRGWRLGGEEFLARLLDRVEGKRSENHHALERAKTAAARADRIVGEMLTELGWRETDLRQQRKCAAEKVQIARRLRAETTLTLKQVAARLEMGSWTNVSKLLYDARKHNPKD